MEDPKKYRLGFPETLEYLEDLISHDLNRIKEIEKLLQKEIVSNPKPNSYGLNYNTPSFLDRGPSKNYYATNEKLKVEKEERISRVIGRINLEVNELGLEADLKEKIDEIVENELYPNTFSKLSMKEFERQAGIKKDFELSQDYMTILNKKSDGTKSLDKIIEEQGQKKDTNMSAGLKFIQSLSSSTAFVQSPPAVTYTKDKDDFSPEGSIF